MWGALYLRRGTSRGTWRSVLALAVIGGLLGAVALGALAGARRTAGAYGRYLDASRASDAFINVPGLLPGMPALEPAQRISRLPEVTTAAWYIGLNCVPVIGGRLRPGFLTNGLDGSLGEYFSQNKLTVLAGRLPPPGATGQIVLSPAIARFFGVGVGGTVTYRFSNSYGGTVTPVPVPPETRSFRVAAIVDVPRCWWTRPISARARSCRRAPPGSWPGSMSTPGSACGWRTARRASRRCSVSSAGFPGSLPR
jgi:hypothetical protein